MLLKYVIKHKNINLMFDYFVRAIVLFYKFNKIKYAFKTLYLI